MSEFEQRKRESRIDILDLVIEVLREHEKALDESLRRLETLFSKQNEDREQLKAMLRYYSSFSK